MLREQPNFYSYKKLFLEIVTLRLLFPFRYHQLYLVVAALSGN